MIKVILNMLMQVAKRGKGVFKFLFVIDDFIRLFTMTILIPLFFAKWGFGPFLVNAGLILGLVIDIHDFMDGGLHIFENK